MRESSCGVLSLQLDLLYHPSSPPTCKTADGMLPSFRGSRLDAIAESWLERPSIATGSYSFNSPPASADSYSSPLYLISVPLHFVTFAAVKPSSLGSVPNQRISRSYAYRSQ